ncbi:carboxypeptidase-like regulatory domain-containing protein [Fulvivirga ligni]|uniref:carboxypeptidase-like regulatory domain-containing protein n=1 Tax=Fulvivirga ligni TaxID=2904246 RepID=UPI001F3DBB8E|nr:carboxypeptidase-like regulatory domain-containing protein [Fulvivirga ligni]UII20350.1 carboxypeptidase-like regulatory domain-containing protein [Fulvivirga ligni]
MPKTLFTALILTFFGVAAFAQEAEIEITGRIIDSETNEPVPYVHVINKTVNKGVVSNTEGRFWVTMDKSDTLVFSSIGFESYAYTIKEDVATDKIDITIALNMSTMELQPVKVFAFRDEKALKQAILNMQVPIGAGDDKEPVIATGFVRPKWTSAEGGISMGGPFSAIYNKVSKEAKEKKKLQQFQRSYDRQLLAKSKYNEKVVIELTGLPEDKVEDFMQYCKLEESFIMNSTEYEIAVAVNQCLTKFIKLEEDDTDQ